MKIKVEPKKVYAYDKEGHVLDYAYAPTDYTITVGDGVTFGIGSDRYAYTVIELKTPKTIVIQEDHETQTGDFYGNQKWVCSPNPDGKKVTLTLRKNGSWKEKGSDMDNCGYYSIGDRNSYRDPSF